jgi:hypothetical protein
MLRPRSLLLAGAVAIPAAAFMFGGWAVTTVDDMPEYAVAGKPFVLTYAVRQHGFAFLSNLNGSVTAHTGDYTRTTSATPLGEGRYRVSMMLPAGTWALKIDNGFTPKSGFLPALKVIPATAATPAPMPPYDRGYQLFLAKGCATCHSHQLIDKSVSLKIGPDLSEPKFTTAYLSSFLANPAVKTDWKTEQRMPNLGLNAAEVSALAAFLNGEKRR